MDELDTFIYTEIMARVPDPFDVDDVKDAIVDMSKEYEHFTDEELDDMADYFFSLHDR